MLIENLAAKDLSPARLSKTERGEMAFSPLPASGGGAEGGEVLRAREVTRRPHACTSRLQHADPPEGTVRNLQPGKVGMYVCGPTVYKPSHIGHMVGPVIFDAVKRYLIYPATRSSGSSISPTWTIS